MLLESPVERPKKTKEILLREKETPYTKTQLVVAKATLQVICTTITNGKRHDFQLFKESQVHCLVGTKLLVDTGYQGIAKMHTASELPKKRGKKNPLTKADKQNNYRIASERVANEHVIGVLKRFRIIAEKYRNRRKRFGLHWNLITGIYNFELRAA